MTSDDSFNGAPRYLCERWIDIRRKQDADPFAGKARRIIIRDRRIYHFNGGPITRPSAEILITFQFDAGHRSARVMPRRRQTRGIITT